jgi:hypothetical protein
MKLNYQDIQSYYVQIRDAEYFSQVGTCSSKISVYKLLDISTSQSC